MNEGIEVDEASMENGLLFVDLSQPINNEESKKIEIKDKKNKIKDKLISLEMEDLIDKVVESDVQLGEGEGHLAPL